ncbi:MAG: hypothetical protein KDJ80_01005 [Nitratireductor sp.]|nr:hypothetical protein [Nitratireductor sp.]
MSGPLQNRVRPDGTLDADGARGLFTGNRGIVHNPDTKRLAGRRWTTPAWICCALRYRDQHRDVWGRNGPDGGTGWTELFFLDEITALAAGHRPCHACRREAARRFGALFHAAHGTASTPQIDRILHGERQLSSKQERQALSAIDLPDLPEGTMVEADGRFHALRGRRALPWSHSGYGGAETFGDLGRHALRLVTPKSILPVLRAGYSPHWHRSAEV